MANWTKYNDYVLTSSTGAYVGSNSLKRLYVRNEPDIPATNWSFRMSSASIYTEIYAQFRPGLLEPLSSSQKTALLTSTLQENLYGLEVYLDTYTLPMTLRAESSSAVNTWYYLRISDNQSWAGWIPNGGQYNGWTDFLELNLRYDSTRQVYVFDYDFVPSN